jgi:5-methylthioadenosine/S-adenosylhomocysteine deaminase
MSIFIEKVELQGKITNIYIEGDRILYIGPEKRKALQTICGRHKVALPTFANCHTHAAMTLFRGYADDMPLQTWLRDKIWPLEAKLTEEDVYWGAKLACLEMIHSGTTLFNDMYWHYDGTARAVEDMGIRAVLSSVLIDLGDAERRKKQLEAMSELYQTSQKYSSRVQFAVAPHAIYTVSAESLRWSAQFAAKHNLLVHLHLSETQQEVRDCFAQHHVLPVEYLKSLGVLSPRVVAVHAVWLQDKELDILRDHQVKLVHNPVSNLKLATGELFRYAAIRQRNIPVGIGTDGCASNNNLDMFEQIKFASLLQKFKQHDPTALPCHEAWELATRAGHEILGVDAGVIAEGKLADLMLVELHRPEMTPQHNVISNLVYAAHGGVVDTVICNGQLLMQHQEVLGEEEILQKAAEAAKQLVLRR